MPFFKHGREGSELTNVLLPSDTAEILEMRCPACGSRMIRGLGALTTKAICRDDGTIIALEARPEGSLTDSREKPFLVQTSRRKKEWEDDLPAGAVVTEEFELS